MTLLPRLGAAALLILSASLSAETITIPIGQQQNRITSQTLPQPGADRSSVSRRFGEPSRRHPAIGQPPITRWDYPGFSVYFEYNHVVHSVRQHVKTSD